MEKIIIQITAGRGPVECCRASGPGGQNVNKVEWASMDAYAARTT